MTPPKPGDEVRVVFTGTAEEIYRAGGHPDGDVVSMVRVRLAGGQIVYVPLVDGIEFTLADPEAAGW